MYQIDLSLGQWMLSACKECIIRQCKLIISHPRQGWVLEWILVACQCNEVFHRPINNNRFIVDWLKEAGVKFLSFFYGGCDIVVFFLNRWEEKTKWGCQDTLHSRNQDVYKVLFHHILVAMVVVVVCRS